MSFLKPVASFAPWIAFLGGRSGPLDGDGSAEATPRNHHVGVGLVFLTGATVAVLGFHNMWTIRHLGVMVNGAAAFTSWHPNFLRGWPDGSPGTPRPTQATSEASESRFRSA